MRAERGMDPSSEDAGRAGLLTVVDLMFWVTRWAGLRWLW